MHLLEAGGAPLARIVPGDGPVLAFALHAGHEVRPEILAQMALSDADRLREEDPATGAMAPAGCTLVEVLRSRFEVDLNRPRFRAVYQGPEDAWGLNVWSAGLPDYDDRVSRAVYDTFYASAFDLLSRVEQEYGRFVVLDLHSYNHRRGGPEAKPDPVSKNPEVNLGTGKLDRVKWEPQVEAFVSAVKGQGYDVRENVKFRGGHFSEWVAETFPDTGCALAIEFKKTYMDEWTGVVDPAAVERNAATMKLAAEAVSATLGNVL
jgi:N-formylglutamate amidohydrolase